MTLIERSLLNTLRKAGFLPLVLSRRAGEITDREQAVKTFSTAR
jgi:hypothetical protein